MVWQCIWQYICSTCTCGTGYLGFFSIEIEFDDLPLKTSALGRARIANFLLQLEWYRHKVAIEGDGVAVHCHVPLPLPLYVMLNGGDHLIWYLQALKS
jgi:hypothetical protein